MDAEEAVRRFPFDPYLRGARDYVRYNIKRAEAENATGQ
jgi:hypothetical protein